MDQTDQRRAYLIAVGALRHELGGDVMNDFILLGVLIAVFVDVAAGICAATDPRIPRPFRLSYWVLGIIASVAAYGTTFQYVYYANSNTRVEGWPVPIVVFQRQDADSPWADFVGPTTVLGYPINVALFMALPCIVLLGAKLLRSRRKLSRHD